MIDVIWFLSKLSARLALVTAVATTVLCLLRSIDARWSHFTADSTSKGWAVAYSPGSPSAPYFELGEVDIYDLKRVLVAMLADEYLIIDHWVIWSPLLALNVLLWWIDRRRKRMGIDDDSWG